MLSAISPAPRRQSGSAHRTAPGRYAYLRFPVTSVATALLCLLPPLPHGLRLFRRGSTWDRTPAFGRDDLLTVAKVADLANTPTPRTTHGRPRSWPPRPRPPTRPTSAAAGPSWPTAPGSGGRARSQRLLADEGGLSGRTAAWRWRSRAACNTARAWPTPVTGYRRRAVGTHGRHRSRGASHGEASGRDGRHTQGKA